MNELDFLDVMNEIDDDLILSAQQIPEKKHLFPRRTIRAAAVAAMLCLMSVTVAAVTISVRVLFSDQEVSNYELHYSGFFSPKSKMTTIEYDLQPQKITLPLYWTEAVTNAWKAFGYEDQFFTGIDLREDSGNRIDFEGISQLERLLGIDLVSSPELDAVTQGAYVTLVVTDTSRAGEQFRSEGMVSPDGIVIYLPLLQNGEGSLSCKTVNYCGLNIFLPLTESFSDQYAAHSVLSSVEKQDLTQSRIISTGGIEITLLQNRKNDSIDPLSGFAAWEQGGIGYLIELKTNYRVNITPEELLHPYMEHLEE